MTSSTPVVDAGDPALSFVAHAIDTVEQRWGADRIDLEAMALVLLLHRVTNTVVYDLESSVHRPAGWSWSAFRALFTLWAGGPMEPSRLALDSGMSRQAVSALLKTLESEGLVQRQAAVDDGRSVLLSLTDEGHRRLEHTFRAHNAREATWAGALTADEQRTFVALLSKLAAAGQQDWVNHRF